MKDLDLKEEMKSIEEVGKAFKKSVITFFVSIVIAIIAHLANSETVDSMIIAYFFYLVAGISWICIIVFKYKELKLLALLAHKRLDELAEKHEQLMKKS